MGLLLASSLQTDADRVSYAAIGVVVLLILVLTAGMLVAAHVIGPQRRHGPVKDSAYESGMPPVMDTRRRFHVRFYIVAVLFLLFDVEVVFLWPWAQVFHQAARGALPHALSLDGATIPLEAGGGAGKGFLLAGMGLFFVLLLFGLFYEWKKGAFRWD